MKTTNKTKIMLAFFLALFTHAVFGLTVSMSPTQI